MSLYVKVFTNFYTHKKTLRLKALIGEAAFWVPPRLWAYAAQNQPDGDFSDYEAPELAEFISYTDDSTVLLQALLKSGFLDPDMRIHDWDEHNGFHKSFAERAKNAAKKRWAQKKGTEMIGEETSIASSNACSILEAQKPTPSKKFPNEIKDQIKTVESEIQRLKDFGKTDDDKIQLKVLVERKKQLKQDYIRA